MNKLVRGVDLKTRFLALMVVAIASTTTGLTSCSTSDQVQAPNSDATNVGDMEGMDHGSMSHGMSMDLGPADADYDLRFIDGMKVHHQGAVDMAKEAQQKSQRPEIKKLADNIIKTQNQEINQLQQWRKAWYPQANSSPMAYDSKMGHMMPMSAEQMKSMAMSGELGSVGAKFDLNFINAMIPHHKGAVEMAQDALSKSKRPEVKQLAQDIIKSQQAEIKQMEQWRQAWYPK